jgi:hypothetical protein
MEVNGQLHAPAALLPWKEPPVPIGPQSRSGHVKAVVTKSHKMAPVPFSPLLNFMYMYKEKLHQFLFLKSINNIYQDFINVIEIIQVEAF